MTVLYTGFYLNSIGTKSFANNEVWKPLIKWKNILEICVEKILKLLRQVERWNRGLLYESMKQIDDYQNV